MHTLNLENVELVINADFILKALTEGIVLTFNDKEKYKIKLEIYKKENDTWKKIEAETKETVQVYENGKWKNVSVPKQLWLLKFVAKDKEE